MRTYLVFLILLLIGSAMSMAQGNQVDISRNGCVERAGILLDEAFLIMKKHYYKTDSVEWKPLMANAKALLNQSSDCQAAYKVLQYCFDQIKENHSFIMPPLKASLYTGNINGSQAGSLPKALSGPIRHELIESSIAYIDVPWISTIDETVCVQFADSVQSLIRTFDRKGITRWIIDLRRNTGGNCWPMLAGLGPLLGNGIHGFFISPEENIPISYRNGVVMQGKQPRCVVSNPHSLQSGKKTVIVLTGRNTSSAGEIVALSFKGLNNVYLYGEPTAGLTTANASYPLSDGSLLVLTVCKEADRNGKIIEGKIQPDEFIQPASTKGTDMAKSAAIMFLQLQ